MKGYWEKNGGNTSDAMIESSIIWAVIRLYMGYNTRTKDGKERNDRTKVNSPIFIWYSPQSEGKCKNSVT